MQNKNKIKRLAKDQCACYLGDKHGIPNYCCWKDDSCVFFGQEDTVPRCGYFEQGVLPADEKLEQDYKWEREIGIELKKAKPKMKCKRCGDTFFANSNRQQYCEKCRNRNQNEKSRIRMRQMRQKQS